MPIGVIVVFSVSSNAPKGPKLLYDRIGDGGSFHLFQNGMDDFWI